MLSMNGPRIARVLPGAGRQAVKPNVKAPFDHNAARQQRAAQIAAIGQGAARDGAVMRAVEAVAAKRLARDQAEQHVARLRPAGGRATAQMAFARQLARLDTGDADRGAVNAIERVAVVDGRDDADHGPSPSVKRRRG